MKCPVCGLEHEGMICSRCGFDESRNLIQYMTLSPVAEEDLDRIAGLKSEWERIADLNIYVEVHYYLQNGDKLDYDHTEEAFLANGSDLKEKQIVWSDMKFPGVEGMEFFTICLMIRNRSEEQKVFVTINNPCINSGFCKAGIKLMNSRKMALRFVMDTEDGKNCQESNDFYLML